MTDTLRTRLSGRAYRQADVFSRQPLSGNGLAVFTDATGLDGATMLALAQEMRQFESIFLSRSGAPNVWRARLFTVEEELDFAGHPVLGAACVLHEATGGDEGRWTLKLNAKDVDIATRARDGFYEARMDQGTPEFGPPLPDDLARAIVKGHGLTMDDLAPGLPVQVVSTGLPYVFLPLRSGLENARPVRPDFEALLAEAGAKFCYPLDLAAREGRSWDNHGLLEDIATGSAAGPAAAYLVHHSQAVPGEELTIHQGRFTGRPSAIRARAEGAPGAVDRASVGGDVVLVARGVFD